MNILYTNKDDNFYEVEILEKPTIDLNIEVINARLYLNNISGNKISIKSNNYIIDNSDFTIITYNDENVPYKSFKATNVVIIKSTQNLVYPDKIYELLCDFDEEYLL